jgi:hypothetical protein
MAIGSVFGIIGSLVPVLIGLVAYIYGLLLVMWIILAGHLSLIFGIPREHPQN